MLYSQIPLSPSQHCILHCHLPDCHIASLPDVLPDCLPGMPPALSLSLWYYYAKYITHTISREKAAKTNVREHTQVDKLPCCLLWPAAFLSLSLSFSVRLATQLDVALSILSALSTQAKLMLFLLLVML